MRFTIPLLAVVIAACSESGGNPELDRVDILCAEDGPIVEHRMLYWQCVQGIDFYSQGEITRASLSDWCAGVIRDYVADGTVVVGTDEAIDRCLDWALEANCVDQDFGSAPECKDLVVGQIPRGGVCELREQCEGAAYCDREPGEACGTCVPTLDDGAPCSGHPQCESGTCLSSGRCGPLRKEGETCGLPSDCDGNLLCTSGVCTNLTLWGELSTCSSAPGFDCNPLETGLYCQQGLCFPYAGEGEDCTTVQCDVREYLFCSAGTCIAPQVSGEGEPCYAGAQADFTARCADGLVCSSLFELDPNTGMPVGVCYRPRDEGEACDAADPLQTCGFFLGCVDGTCRYSEYSGMCP